MRKLSNKGFGMSTMIIVMIILILLIILAYFFARNIGLGLVI